MSSSPTMTAILKVQLNLANDYINRNLLYSDFAVDLPTGNYMAQTCSVPATTSSLTPAVTLVAPAGITLLGIFPQGLVSVQVVLVGGQTLNFTNITSPIILPLPLTSVVLTSASSSIVPVFVFFGGATT